jgi:hypothetical protein
MIDALLGPAPARRAVFFLIAVSVVVLPLFLCASLWVDASFYGIAARLVLDGGVLERDLVYIYPPATVWLRLITEGLFGGRNEWIRGLDLFFAVGSLIALVGYGRGVTFGSTRPLIFWSLFVFYLGSSWVCHAQPDVWMLFPTALALRLRRRQLERLATPQVSVRRLMGAAVGEGLVGGFACLIKPQAIVPLAAVVVTGWLLYRHKPVGLPRFVADSIALLLGGAIMFELWMAWLAFDGGADAFWANLREWGPGYFDERPSLLRRLMSLVTVFPGWSLVHMPMLLLSLHSVLRVLRFLPAGNDVERRDEALYSAFYLGWVVEAVGMQWGYPYHLFPPLLIALRWLAGRLSLWVPRSLAIAATMGCLCLILIEHDLFAPRYIRWWPECIVHGSTPLVRDRLRSPQAVDEQDLARVGIYLRSLPVNDGELTCYHSTTSNLYLTLGLHPSTRWIWPDVAVAFFRNREPQMRHDLAASRQRWVVSDLERAFGGPPGPTTGTAADLSLPSDFPDHWRDRFPWNQPIVFRAGRFLVHRVDQSVTELTGVEAPVP